jgi:hypothetical protein
VKNDGFLSLKKSESSTCFTSVEPENDLIEESEIPSEFQRSYTSYELMTAIYVHLTDDSHEKAILKASGIEIDEPEKELIKPVRCNRCKE